MFFNIPSRSKNLSDIWAFLVQWSFHFSAQTSLECLVWHASCYSFDCLLMSFAISIRKVWLFIQTHPLALMLLLMTNYMRDSSAILKGRKRCAMGLIRNCHVLIQLHQILWRCIKLWSKIASFWIPMQWGWNLVTAPYSSMHPWWGENICYLRGHS